MPQRRLSHFYFLIGDDKIECKRIREWKEEEKEEKGAQSEFC